MVRWIARAQTWWWMRKQDGQTTSEYLVIAGVVVAIILAIAATFQTQIKSALGALMGNVNAGAGGS
jgi:Flp pilus assembly pilin Flp